MKQSRRVMSWTTAGLIAAVVAAWLTGGPALAATSKTVGIKEFKFAPSALTVSLGTTVTWVNHDEEVHTVTSASGAFTSTGLVKDDSFAQTFTKLGTYQYFCALHPHMKATVVVR
jgi:plastocyanin